jgi:hypothetical protein
MIINLTGLEGHAMPIDLNVEQFLPPTGSTQSGNVSAIYLLLSSKTSRNG